MTLQLWGVDWWNAERGDFQVGRVHASTEDEAREAWRSYLNGLGVTQPADAGRPAHAYVEWIDPEWETALREGRAGPHTPLMESWHNAEFVAL